MLYTVANSAASSSAWLPAPLSKNIFDFSRRYNRKFQRDACRYCSSASHLFLHTSSSCTEIWLRHLFIHSLFDARTSTMFLPGLNAQSGSIHISNFQILDTMHIFFGGLSRCSKTYLWWTHLLSWRIPRSVKMMPWTTESWEAPDFPKVRSGREGRIIAWWVEVINLQRSFDRAGAMVLVRELRISSYFWRVIFIWTQGTRSLSRQVSLMHVTIFFKGFSSKCTSRSCGQPVFFEEIFSLKLKIFEWTVAISVHSWKRLLV